MTSIFLLIAMLQGLNPKNKGNFITDKPQIAVLLILLGGIVDWIIIVNYFKTFIQ